MSRVRPISLRIAFAVAALSGLSLVLPLGGAPWTPALLLVWDSNVMAVVAVVGSVSVWVMVGAAQRRAITPGLPLLACATVGSVDALVEHRLLVAAGDRRGRSMVWDSGHDTHWAAALTPSAAAAWLTRTVVVLSLSIGSVAVIGATGHLPRAATAAGTAGLIATACLALTGTLWGLHTRRTLRDRSVTKLAMAVLARRGPHAFVVAGVGEVAMGLMVALIAVILTHTKGGTAPGVLEVLAIALIARLFTLVPAPPLGLGLADGILVLGLIMINVPMDVAMATTLAWRGTGLLVMTVGVLSARSWRPHVESASQTTASPTDSRLGRSVHRVGFAILALLPGWLASLARRRLFDTLFGLADDPWVYSLMPYEQRKQAQLTAAIPPCARVIVEVGCADGQNVAALARLFPASKVIGIDISERAIATATSRIRHQTNAMVARADAQSVAQVLDEFRGQVDVLVLSEVLYYLGTSHQVHQALTGASALLSPDATVVLIHGAYDAQRLHAPACAALGVVHKADTMLDDPDRPYVVTIALHG